MFQMYFEQNQIIIVEYYMEVKPKVGFNDIKKWFKLYNYMSFLLSFRALVTYILVKYCFWIVGVHQNSETNYRIQHFIGKNNQKNLTLTEIHITY